MIPVSGRTAKMALAAVIAAASALAAQEPDKPGLVGNETCLSCHSDKEAFKNSIHFKAMPHVKGAGKTESCETCHGPGEQHASSGGDVAMILNPGKSAGQKGSAACLSCHGGEKHRMFWDGSVHDIKGVSCVSCHSVHGKNQRLLKKATETDLCLSCHRDVRASMLKRSKHPLHDSSSLDGQGKMACSSCHNAHGSQSEKLVAARSVNDKCFECHTEKKAPVLWEHGPVKEDCLTCHSPHGSSNDKLLVAKVPRLCQQCHMQGRHQSGALGPNSSYAVGRACLNCHSMIHGSNHPSGTVLQR